MQPSTVRARVPQLSDRQGMSSIRRAKASLSRFKPVPGSHRYYHVGERVIVVHETFECRIGYPYGCVPIATGSTASWLGPGDGRGY